MKIRKFLSVFCATALLVSALPAAAAVESDPLSEYAGQTIPVQVVEETENGWTSRVIEVAIPEGATKEEKDAIVHSAAFGNGTATTRSTNSENFYELSYKTDFEITNTAQKVGGGARPANVTEFKKVYINTQIKYADGTAVGRAKLIFWVEDASSGYTTTPATVTIDPDVMEVVIACGGFPTTEKGINVYAMTDLAWIIGISYLRVRGATG